MRTRPKGDTQQIGHCVCSSVCDCVEAILVRQVVHLQKDGHNLNECILEESKLAPLIGWNEAKIFLI